MRAVIAIVSAALGLAACDRVSPAKPGAGDTPEAATSPRSGATFGHSQTGDLSGYFNPTARVGPDDFRLTTVFVGQGPAFEAWEAGRRGSTFAPVMLEFQAPDGATERVLPDRYSVGDGHVRMSGRSRGHGRIMFDGRLDQGALSTARRNLGEGEAPAMTATVTVGERSFTGVELAWSGGD